MEKKEENMTYEVLEKELQTLTKDEVEKVNNFILYLKLKEQFSDYEKWNETKKIEEKLDEADLQADSTNERLTHEEVFSNIRSKIKVC